MTCVTPRAWNFLSEVREVSIRPAHSTHALGVVSVATSHRGQFTHTTTLPQIVINNLTKSKDPRCKHTRLKTHTNTSTNKHSTEINQFPTSNQIPAQLHKVHRIPSFWSYQKSPGHSRPERESTDKEGIGREPRSRIGELDRLCSTAPGYG